MSTVNNNPNLSSQKAQEGLKTLSRVGGINQQARAADKLVQDIGQESTDPLEQSLCQVAHKATETVRSDNVKVAVSQATLKALAQGVTGSLGGVLAGVAVGALGLSGGGPIQDRVALGRQILSEIASGDSTADERTVANMAGSTLNHLDSDSSKLSVAQAMLAAVSTGVSSDLGGFLAGIGAQALQKSGLPT